VIFNLPSAGEGDCAYAPIFPWKNLDCSCRAAIRAREYHRKATPGMMTEQEIGYCIASGKEKDTYLYTIISSQNLPGRQ
jgi:hypothetical protein